jgi:ABC-type oligopeptide transport system ATPase subunit
MNANNKELEIIDNELSVENIRKLGMCDNDDIDDYIKLLGVIISNREFDKLSETCIAYDIELVKVVDDELSEMRRKLSDVSAELWLLYDTDETDEMILENENLLKDLERLDKLKSRLKNKGLKSVDMTVLIDKNKKLRDKLQMQKQSHNCPSCKTRLRFVDGFLSTDTVECELPTNLTMNELSKLIDDMTRDVVVSKEIEDIQSSYEGILPDILDVRKDLVYMRDYRFEQVDNEKNKVFYESCIRDGLFSKTCMSFKEKVAVCKAELNKLERHTCVETDMTEDELRSYIEASKAEMVEKAHCCKRIEDLLFRSNRYKNANDELLAVYDVSIVDAVSTLTTELGGGELELGVLYTKRKLHSGNLEQIGLWGRMMDELKTYRVWEEKLLLLQETETTRRNEYRAALTLKDKILEAESVAMINLVESINTHARVYLEDFFEDDPIVVTLQAFKHTKKATKAQISMDIEYKGMECDLQMLSGGEMSRIVLAYTLALAEMFNSPLLLLDECTSSLDQETTNHVFDAIKEHFNGKLTIIVAHQVVTGIFDRSVDLDI